MKLLDLTAEGIRELSPSILEEHAACLAELAAELLDEGSPSESRAHAFVVPGRIELLGKHTDYAGGRSLACATEQGFCLVATAREDRRVVIRDLVREQSTAFDLKSELDPSAPNWTRYARTVARRLTRDFGDLRGADVALASDLHAAAGLSSSSALVVSVYQGLAAVNGLADRADHRAAIGSPEALAGYLGAIESGGAFGPFAADHGVGTFGGSEDHTAILLSVADHAGQYGYAPVRLERSIRLPDDYLLVVVASGVRAEKTGEAMAAYNRISLAATAAARLWRERTAGSEPDLASALRSGPDAAHRLLEIVRSGAEGFSGSELADRVEHFRQESERLTTQAGDALEQGDLTVFGLLVDRSQHLAQKLLGNQIAETVALAEAARELGAAAASSFGAGFGGAVWALVEETEADEFAESWLASYLEDFPEHEERALALATRAASGVRKVGDCP